MIEVYADGSFSGATRGGWAGCILRPHHGPATAESTPIALPKRLTASLRGDQALAGIQKTRQAMGAQLYVTHLPRSHPMIVRCNQMARAASRGMITKKEKTA